MLKKAVWPLPLLAGAADGMPTERIVSLQEVMARFSRSKSGIYDDPDFPRPIPNGKRRVGWLESELNKYLADRIAERDAARTRGHSLSMFPGRERNPLRMNVSG
jgi:predicted DNA-binding transcriptional regulator AlpA